MKNAKHLHAVWLGVIAIFVFFGIERGQTPQDLTPAKVISPPFVETPAEAKDAGIGGKITVHVLVNENGDVTSADDPQGPEYICPGVDVPAVKALRSAATEAAMKVRFSPAIAKDRPVSSELWMVIEFTPSVRILSAPPKDDSPATPTVSNGSPKWISGGVLNSKASDFPKPRYPPAAMAVRASGAVSVQVMVDTDGSVYFAQAVSGHPLLRDASRIAACKARFPQTLLSGLPVRVSGVVVYNFVP